MIEQSFKTALITGIQGSGGAFLAEYIVQNHPLVEVHGISRWHSTASTKNLRDVQDKIRVHECDLVDLSSVIRTLDLVKPDVIFHLASHANVKAGFVTPLAVIQNNVMGTANLFEGIRTVGIDPIVQLCSTSEVYGQVDPKNVPISEECPLRPSSPYAVSKAAQDHLGFCYFRSYGQKIIRTRMFSYLNPRRTDLFSTAFVRQVARIEQGIQSELLHGNLDSTRTIIDVRDAMAAYWDAARLCTPGEAYNIGGNTVMTVGNFLDIVKSKAKVPIKSKVDPNLLRPADVTLQIPNIEKFTSATNWRPQYSFEQSLDYLLNFWRVQVLDEVRELHAKGNTR